MLAAVRVNHRQDGLRRAARWIGDGCSDPAIACRGPSFAAERFAQLRMRSHSYLIQAERAGKEKAALRSDGNGRRENKILRYLLRTSALGIKGDRNPAWCDA